MNAMNTAEHARINALVYQFANTYLEKRGWFESLDGIPRNKDGLVPWITYPAFRQLQRIVKPGCESVRIWLRRLLASGGHRAPPKSPASSMTPPGPHAWRQPRPPI